MYRTMPLVAILTFAFAASAQTPIPHSDVFGMTLLDQNGARVIAVERGSEAAHARVSAGDVVTTIGDTSVTTVAEAFAAIEKCGNEIALCLQGAGKHTKTLHVRRPNLWGRIAFQSTRTGNGDIYAMNADGTNITRLTDSSESEGNPVWSPDGARIALTQTRPGGFLELCTMDADGGHFNRMTDTPFAETLPRWSPDGKDLLLFSNQNNKWEIFRTPWNVYDPVSVIETSPDPNNMAWTYPAFDVSPNGEEIVYPKLKSGTEFDDHILNLRTGQSRAFGAGLPSKLRPSWSKDGRRLLVTAGVPYVVDLASDRSINLGYASDEAELLSSLTWSPKGDMILVAKRPAKGEPIQLYVTSLDGRKRFRLTYSLSDDQFADWTGKGK